MPYVDIYANSDTLTKFTVEFFKDDSLYAYKTANFDLIPNLDFITDIVATTQANPCNVNAPSHGLLSGNVIYLYGIEGMVELNGGPYTITKVDENNFTLDGVDSSSYAAFTTSGGVYKREFYKTKVRKRVYAGGTGYVHQMKLTSTGADRPFTIHSFVPYFKAVSTRNIE